MSVKRLFMRRLQSAASDFIQNQEKVALGDCPIE